MGHRIGKAGLLSDTLLNCILEVKLDSRRYDTSDSISWKVVEVLDSKRTYQCHANVMRPESFSSTCPVTLYSASNMQGGIRSSITLFHFLFSAVWL
jgi:hypothetical protein